MAFTSATMGIDPGKSGAIAIVSGKRVLKLTIHDMPQGDRNFPIDLLELDSLAMHIRHANTPGLDCAVESVHAMPRQGVSSTFRFGRNFGHALSFAVSATGRRPKLIRPQVWKEYFDLIGEIKDASRIFAREVFVRRL